MAIDPTRSGWSNQFDMTNGVGVAFAEEGQIVTSVLASGVERAGQGAASASLNVVGFCIKDTVSPATTRQYTTEGIIPSSSPYEVDIGHTLITVISDAKGDVAVWDVTAEAWLTLETYDGTPSAASFQVNDAAGFTTGELIFNAAEAGHEIEIFANVTMTARERDGLFQQRHINSNSQADLGMIGVASGVGTLYTDQFDTSVGDWTTGVLSTGAAGRFTMDGAGTSLATKAHVISVPTVEDPWLGIRFNLGQ